MLLLFLCISFPFSENLRREMTISQVIKRTWTHRREFEFSAPIKFSSLVGLLAFKSYTNWDNDEKDWQTWTCNYKRRSPYRRIVDLNSRIRPKSGAHMKLVETEQDIPENISIPIKGRSGDKFFTIQNDKQKRGIILYLTILLITRASLCLKTCRAIFSGTVIFKSFPLIWITKIC